MKKVWSEVLQEVVLAIITLGISLLRKGKKRHQQKLDELNPPSEGDAKSQ